MKKTSIYFSIIFVVSTLFLFSCGADVDVFFTTWEIMHADNTTVMLPLVENGEYDFTVYWGDGKKNRIKHWDNISSVYKYESPGTYNVRIEGKVVGWSFGESRASCYNLIEISNWGNMAFGNTTRQFFACRNLEITAEDTPDLSKTISLREAFWGCNKLTRNDSFNSWDVSSVRNMSSMFVNSAFNSDISSWDVSSVRNMRSMFARLQFNGDISNWDVSSVTDMSGMFAGSQFNGNISNWDVSSVTDMSGMFAGSQFNGNISNWDVSSVEKMRLMFAGSNFKGDILSWDISNVTDMSSMFSGLNLDTDYYDSILIKWSELPVQHGVVFGAGNSKYSAKAIEARTKMIKEFDWTIFDGGLKE